MAGLDGLPPPRLLVNNASRFVFDGADDFTAEGWDSNLAINLRAPALLSQAFAARAEGGGLIVNLLDAKLASPNPDFFTYTVSKTGLAGLTDLCARAWAGRGIRVCGIAPAVTLVSGEQKNFEAVHALNALRRGVRVEEVVAALRFIIATPTLTGQTLTLDGGQRFLGLPHDVQLLESKDG
jgi:NAD(P)-dependent dehydrogenase (short-subunit alcohol dehydrogenase family)